MFDEDKVGEIYHDYTANPVCPYCGYAAGDAWEWEEDDGEHECGKCERTYRYSRHVVVNYSTSKMLPNKEVYCGNRDCINRSGFVCPDRGVVFNNWRLVMLLDSFLDKVLDIRSRIDLGHDLEHISKREVVSVLSIVLAKVAESNVPSEYEYDHRATLANLIELAATALTLAEAVDSENVSIENQIHGLRMHGYAGRKSSPQIGTLALICREVERARAKFPGPTNQNLVALVEEVGELAKAVLDDSAREIESEAIQCATMAIRIIEEGPGTQYAREKEALKLLLRYGGTDGAHHKAWAIDQAIRILAGQDYERIKKEACNGEDGPSTYSWDEGIAP